LLTDGFHQGLAYLGPATTIACTVVSTICIFSVSSYTRRKVNTIRRKVELLDRKLERGDMRLDCVHEELGSELRRTRSDVMAEIMRAEYMATCALRTQHPKQKGLDTAGPKSYPSTN